MIDTHCHVLKEFYDDVDKIIKKMKDNIIVISNTNQEDIKEVINLCQKYKNVYGTIGIHPEYANGYNEDDLRIIESHLKNEKIVGIGEIGLDYHYSKTNKEKQKKLFIDQINLANKYKKTIVIHSRDAEEDTYNIIEKYKNDDIKCNMHCYSYGYKMAQKLTKKGITLGIGGILTFKNEKKLKEVVRNIDIKNLVLETDSPYLTPEPNRGKKNEPYNIEYVAKKIAEIKNIEFYDVIRQTEINAKKLYGIK